MKTKLSELIGKTAMIYGKKESLLNVESRLIKLGYNRWDGVDESNKDDVYANSIAIIDYKRYYYCFLPEHVIDTVVMVSDLEID